MSTAIAPCHYTFQGCTDLATRYADDNALTTISNLCVDRIDPRKLLAHFLMEIDRNPNLQGCSKSSYGQALLECATIGLYPNASYKLVYLIPYGKELKAMIGYQGMIALAARNGLIVTANVVYQGDQYVCDKGSNPSLSHIPDPCADRSDSNIIAAYCITKFMSNGNIQHIEDMTLAEIKKIRAMSKSSRGMNPWNSCFSEMARKTVVRRAAKFWNLCPEDAGAVDVDDRNSFEFEASAAKPAAEDMKSQLMAQVKRVMPPKKTDTVKPDEKETVIDTTLADPEPEELSGDVEHQTLILQIKRAIAESDTKERLIEVAREIKNVIDQLSEEEADELRTMHAKQKVILNSKVH